MNPLLQILSDLPFILYYIAEAIVLSLIPRRLRYKDISGQTVLITGAGSGIGRQLAIRFSRLKTRLVLLDLNMKGLRETEFLLDRNCNGVFLYECDVADRDAVYAVAKKVKKEAGHVEILVNNAGIVTGKRLLDCKDEMIEKTIAVNTLAHFWTCKAFLSHMRAANKGHLVFVASVAGLGGGPKLIDYCTSKFANVGFEESLRLEHEEEGLDGIKSTIVCPYLVNTGLFEGFDIPFLRSLSPEYVADEILSAVLVNKEVVVIPGYLYLLFILKKILPRTVVLALYDVTGANKCMDEFKGRVVRNNDEKLK